MKGDFKCSKLDKMRRQRNMLQKKGQDKNPQDQINEEEIGKLPKKRNQNNYSKDIQNLGNKMEKINV